MGAARATHAPDHPPPGTALPAKNGARVTSGVPADPSLTPLYKRSLQTHLYAVPPTVTYALHRIATTQHQTQTATPVAPAPRRTGAQITPQGYKTTADPNTVGFFNSLLGIIDSALSSRGEIKS